MQTVFKNKLLFIGSVWKWVETFPTFSPTNHNCKLQIKLNGNEHQEFNSVGSGNSFEFKITANENKSLVPGRYYWIIFITDKADNIVAYKEGYKYLKALPSAGGDLRTDNRIILDNIIATIKSGTSKESGEIQTPDGVMIKYKSLTELHSLRVKYESIVAAESKPKPKRVTKIRLV